MKIHTHAGNNYTYEQIALAMDHALLRPDMTSGEIIEGCVMAKQYKIGAVSVKPCYLQLVLEALSSSSVKVGTVVGFPHGSSTGRVKAYEAMDAVENGAQELDIVINYGALRSGEANTVREELHQIVSSVKHRALIKVILETYFLTNDEKKLACQIVEEVGGDFVKTSSGFAPRGASLADVKLMRAAVSNHIQIKAAGKIRTLSQVLRVMEAGCSRIGTSATQSILNEFLESSFDN